MKAKPKFSVCNCGIEYPKDEAEFWGECQQCRTRLPIHTNQRGDSGCSGGQADRRYHGGQGSRGEW